MARPQLQPAIGLQQGVELPRLLGQILVVARLVDRPVEALVGVIVGVGAARPRRRLAGFVCGHERGALRVGDPAGGERAAHALQGRHRLEALDHRAQRQAGHEGATPRLKLHHAGRGELHQRLPDRRARHAEPRGEALLVQALPRPEMAGDDVLLQLIPERFGAAHASFPPERCGS